MKLDRIEKPPEIGDYVFCSKWGDRSPSDGWAIGVLESSDENRYKVSSWFLNFRHCQVINQVQGLLIMGFYPSLEGTDLRIWNKRVNDLGDEEVINFFRWFLDPKEPTEDD